MAKLEIKIEGFELRAEGEAAFAALRSFVGGIARAAGNFANAEDETEDEGEGEAGDETEEEFAPAEEEGFEDAEEPGEPEESEEGSETNTSLALNVIKSEARKAGARGTWFSPPAAWEMANRAGISESQFRSAFQYLKRLGRIEVDAASEKNPRPIRVPLDGGDE